MAIQGLRMTSNFVADQRPKNWRETILLLYPNGKAPLTALTSLMKSKSTDDAEFNWWEKALPDQRLELSASITNVATVIPVLAGALSVGVGHVLRVEHTEELIYVAAAPTIDTSLPTVVRGFAGTTATAVTLGAGVSPKLHVVATAFEEGSAAPSGINYDPTKRFNYTEIFRNTLEMTRTAQKTRLRTGDAVKEAKRECLELHSIEMEKALIFGKRFEGTLSGKPHRMTGGIISQIDAANITTFSSNTVNLTKLEDALVAAFAFGSQEKLAFMSNKAQSIILRAIRKNAEYQYVQGQQEFGMMVNRLVTPYGTLVIKTHPLFNQLVSGADYFAVDSWALIVDAGELVYRYIDDTMYQKELQTNGLDSIKSGYLTECGLELHHGKAHSLWKGIVTGAVDS